MRLETLSYNLKRATRSLTAAVAALALGAMTGCAMWTDDEPAGAETAGRERNVYLTLEVSTTEMPSTRGGMTRAAGDDTYFEEPDRECERLNTLRVIIVNKSTGTVEANRQVKMGANGQPTGDNLTFKVKAGEKKIYLWGNEQTLPAELQEVLAGQTAGTTFATTAVEGATWSRAAGRALLDLRERSEWEYVPMSEAFDVTVAESTSDEDVYQTESLFITRAVTKFSFEIKKSADFTGASVDEIEAIEVSGVGASEFALPRNTVYDPAKGVASNYPLGGRYITQFSVPETGNPRTAFEFALPSALNPANLGATGYKYEPSIYLPESAGASDFECRLRYTNGEYSRPVKLENLPTLARNTHVKVVITIGNNKSMLLTVTALPWDYEENSFDYSDHIGQTREGALAFVAGTYASLDMTTARVVMNTYPQALEGTFGLSSPVGARWDAYLVTRTGEQNAIQFKTTDASGAATTSTHIWGYIDNRKVNFTVVPIMSAGTEARSATMHVIVTTSTGVTVPVNILTLGGYGSGVGEATFIQNPM